MTTAVMVSGARLMRRVGERVRRVRADDGGFAPLTMLLGVGLLIIPVLLLVLTLPTWAERTVDARDTASQAARVLVTADTWPAGVAAAGQTVSEEATNDGLNPSDVTASFTGSLDPGATVTATITVTIPAGAVPGIGAFGTMHYTARSTQHVDDYRSNPGGFSNSEGLSGPNPSVEGDG